MKKLKIALAALAIAALSACTSAAAPDDTDVNKSVNTQSVQAESKPAASVSVKTYFDAFAAQEPEPMREAAKDAAEGSTAERYLEHQANVVEANDANGYPYSAETAEYDKGVVNVCSDEYCTKYADIKFDGDKIASFTIDGKDMSKRLVLGDGETIESNDLVGFEVLSAYQSISDDLHVVVKYTTHNRPMSFSYQATYRDPSGRQINDSDSTTPSSVVADSYQLGIVIFPGAEIGGDMQLSFGDDGEGQFVFETVKVPLPKN